MHYNPPSSLSGFLPAGKVSQAKPLLKGHRATSGCRSYTAASSTAVGHLGSIKNLSSLCMEDICKPLRLCIALCKFSRRAPQKPLEQQSYLSFSTPMDHVSFYRLVADIWQIGAEKAYKKNSQKFLKTPWTAVLGTPCQCPGKNALFCQQIKGNPWDPAGRPMFVPPGVPGTPGDCPRDFLKVMYLFLSSIEGRLRLPAFSQTEDQIFTPNPQPQISLLRIFRLQPGLKWRFSLRRTWSGQKLLPLQFPGLSLP